MLLVLTLVIYTNYDKLNYIISKSYIKLKKYLNLKFILNYRQQYIGIAINIITIISNVVIKSLIIIENKLPANGVGLYL